MYYVYIIYSKKINKKYIGYSSDIKQRVEAHNKGDSVFTKKGIPWFLIYYEAFLSENDALKEEKFLKSGRGRDRLKYLLDNTFKEKLF